jgi:hypothetical protein
VPVDPRVGKRQLMAAIKTRCPMTGSDNPPAHTCHMGSLAKGKPGAEGFFCAGRVFVVTT